MKKLLIGFVVVIIVIILVFLYQTQQSALPSLQPSSKSSTISPSIAKINHTATFAIFTNGTFRIFTDKKYHNKSKDVFIQSDNVNRVYVKKIGITWNDFFITLPMTLKKDCLTTGTGQVFCANASHKLSFYINGIEDSNALSREIKANDQLLVSYGVKDNKEIESQLEKLSMLSK